MHSKVRATDRLPLRGRKVPVMRLKNAEATDVMTRREAYEAFLPLTGSRVLELGCGAAELTHEIARNAKGVSITALEVDHVQHQKNMITQSVPNVTFGLGGAEDIPAPDGSFDIVLMFRSLHHVPVQYMDRALLEIRRVLKPGGLAYFEEPVFDGEHNEIMRIFHDEEVVREMAFGALKRAVMAGNLELVAEIFFLTPRRYADWAEFERSIRERTHTAHGPSHAQWDAVKARFMQSATPEGAVFMQPMRVDVLRRPGHWPRSVP